MLGCFFNAQTDTAPAVNFQNFNRYFLTHLQVIGSLSQRACQHLRDVNQTFFTATDGNERAKVNDTGHFTVVDTAHFDFSVISSIRRIANFAFSPSVAAIFTVPSSSISMVVPVSSVSARITEPPLPITSFDLVWIDLDGVDTWSELRNVATRRVNRLFHHAQDVQTRTFSLVQSNLHDLFGDTFNFDIHLQCRDTVAGTPPL